MMAVIMAGGKGTRLKPLTMSIPKPLLPLGETPIIEIVIKQLVLNGFDHIVVTLGHMAPIMQSSIGDGQRFGIKIEYVKETEPLGTAGALRLINNLEEYFLVMNGDLLTTINYRDLYNTHVQKKSLSTISIHERSVNIDYGVIEYNRESKEMVGYTEKPTINYWVSMGINIINKKAIDYIPKEGKFDIPDLMSKLREENKVQCYPTNCYWQDIGRFDDYQKASKDFVENPEYFFTLN